MISIAITVCNEHKELETLLDYLQERALSPEYEIIIQIDEQNHTPEVVHTIIDRGIKHHFFPLNKDFAAYKNELIKHCSGEYIFFLDADEIPNEYLIYNLPLILKSNPHIDMFLVPRINTVNNLGLSNVQKWGWNINKLENYISEKEFDLNDPQDKDEYELLKKYNLIIEENISSK
jgi:glycosyltransferase involved in cell wall biosynthesis